MKKTFNTLILVVCCFTLSQAQLFETLPGAVQQSVMWYADLEEGNLQDWTDQNSSDPGGNIDLNGVDQSAVSIDSRFAHTGKYSLKTSLKNAFNTSTKEIRLVRWADNALDQGGKNLPGTAYYSTFAYMPYVYNAGNNSTDSDWTIIEFKNSNSSSAPIWKVIVEFDEESNKMVLALKSNTGEFKTYSQETVSQIHFPVNKWSHIEVYYEASDPNQPNGQISLWQDGESIFEINDVVTSRNDKTIEWSLTNSAEHITGEPIDGRASIYYDDSFISALAIHPYLDVVAALPLELVSFNVLNVGKEVQIKWSAASESNIKQYIIQRRFETEERFEDIDILSANNDPDVTSEYSTLDLQSKKAGVYFYRLHVKDNDGQEFFSDLQSVNIRSRNIAGIAAFPNPVARELIIEGLGAEEELTQIQIFDLQGHRYFDFEDYTSLSTSVDLEGILPGMYILQISKGLSRFSRKIIKQ